MRKLRVLAIMHERYVPPDSIEGLPDREIFEWKMEYDVMSALEHLEHDARALGVATELTPVREQINAFKPHIVFNLLEEFGELGTYVPYLLAYLELLRMPYTGCNPRGLMLADNKSLMKKVCKYHRIRTPDFAVFPRGRAFKDPPKKLRYPLIVKSATEHGSAGLSQASVVWTREKLMERVAFVHEQIGSDALAEEFIDGRELYVGITGNRRLQTFPIWEMSFESWPDDVPRLATNKVKFDLKYQERVGLKTRRAKDLPEDLERHIIRLCKRVYRLLGQSGYARIDLRLTPEGEVWLLESNPNPQLAYGEDFAESAHAAGLEYEPLVQRILNLGLAYRADWRGG